MYLVIVLEIECFAWSCVFQIVFFIGTLFNECINIVLKHWIQEPRPMTRAQIWTEYGMPASHSQFMCFFTQYVLLFILIR